MMPMRRSHADLRGIDGAERPGADALIPDGPRILPRTTLARLGDAAERLWPILDGTVRAEIARLGIDGLAEQLGFSAEQRRWIALRSRQAPPVRADFVPTRGGFKLVEWNVDPCLGGWAGRRLFEGFAGKARGLEFVDPAAALAASVRVPLVALRRRDLPSWGGSAECLAQALGARVVTVDDLPPDGEILRLFHIDHVSPEMEPLRERLIFGFDCELWSDKQWLARWQVPAELRRFVAPSVTVSKSMRREEWVLKPHAGSAGAGVCVGREVDEAGWQERLTQALAEPGWTAQRYMQPRIVDNAYLDVQGRRVVQREIETWSVFLIDGRFAGAYVRSQPVEEGVVIGGGARFNVVATKQQASPWKTKRLRTFEALALEHLDGHGGARTQAPPAEARRGFPGGALPEDGVPVAKIVAHLRQHLLPFCHDKRAPGYLAHLDVPPADLSIAAGTLIRALAQDPVTWTSSRAGGFLEKEFLGWLTQLAFPGVESATALACSGGTQANLHAVLMARNLALPDCARSGLSGTRGMRVLATAAAHGSIAAAVRHAGLGSVVTLPVDEHDRLRLEALEAELKQQPGGLLVLTAGTVGVGAIDPLPEAIALARQHGARVHVDAAHGGMLLWSKHARAALEGLWEADTITVDPHKILGLNQGLGALMVRRAADREAVAKDPAPYFSAPADAPEDWRYSLDGTRPLHALGAWIMLRHLGRAGYQRIVDRLLRLTRYFVGRLQGFELHSPPPMNLVAFRRGHDDDAVARTLSSLARHRLSRYQSPRGAFLRAVLVNPATTEETLDDLVEALCAR